MSDCGPVSIQRSSELGTFICSVQAGQSNDCPSDRLQSDARHQQSRSRPKRTASDTISSSSTQGKSLPTVLDICIPIIDKKELSDVDTQSQQQWEAEHVSEFVRSCLTRWGPTLLPVQPEYFLQRILQGRGYSTEHILPCNAKTKPKPSEKQVHDYDNDLVWAIRDSDLAKLTSLYNRGRSMSACNRHSESIVHMACRRSDLDIVLFLLQHGADISIVDDFGRTPLHDACWRPEPRFDIVAVIMEANIDLIRYSDVRGSTPLNYVRQEHWIQWCAFLFHMMEKHWPPLNAVHDNEQSMSKKARRDM